MTENPITDSINRISSGSGSLYSNDNEVISEVNSFECTRVNDDIILKDYLTEIDDNKKLLLLLTLLGYFLPRKDDSKIKIVLARTWQIILFMFGGVGFIWHAFVFGISHMKSIKELRDGDHVPVEIFFDVVLFFYTFLVPLSQICSLMYGLHVYANRKLNQTIDPSIIREQLSERMKCTIIFFISMSMCVIIIQSSGLSPHIYESNFDTYDDEDLEDLGVQTFSLYVLHEFFVLFYNFAVTCLLSVVMIFTSLTLHEIKSRQEKILEKVKDNTITAVLYFEEKKKISTLHEDLDWTLQIVTFTAGLNAFVFVLMVWYWEYYYGITSYSFQKRDAIFFDFKLAPFLLKEIIFFFYLLYTVASININQDNMSEIVKIKYYAEQTRDTVRIHIDCFQSPTHISLLFITVRKQTFLFTLFGVLINFIVAIADIQKKIG